MIETLDPTIEPYPYPNVGVWVASVNVPPPGLAKLGATWITTREDIGGPGIQVSWTVVRSADVYLGISEHDDAEYEPQHRGSIWIVRNYTAGFSTAIEELLCLIEAPPEAVELAKDVVVEPHNVMRQDDNGHEFLVDSFPSKYEAAARLRELESHLHKQHYWLERA